MESSSSKIVNIIEEIKPLLQYAEEQQWFQYFEKIESAIYKGEDGNAIDSLRMSFKGGMGSFSDLVLHKNGKPLIDENNKLEALKNKLFDYCEMR